MIRPRSGEGQTYTEFSLCLLPCRTTNLLHSKRAYAFLFAFSPNTQTSVA